MLDIERKNEIHLQYYVNYKQYICGLPKKFNDYNILILISKSTSRKILCESISCPILAKSDFAHNFVAALFYTHIHLVKDLKLKSVEITKHHDEWMNYFVVKEELLIKTQNCTKINRS